MKETLLSASLTYISEQPRPPPGVLSPSSHPDDALHCSYLYLWMRALNIFPSLQHEEKLVHFTPM